MHVTTHIDFGIMSVRRALTFGVRHFEHAYTLGVEVISPSEGRAAWARMRQQLGADTPAGFYWGVLEQFNMLGPNDPGLLALIEDLARSGATVTPTLHIFAQRVGFAPYTTKSLGTFDRSDAWTPTQRDRARRGYEILAGYVRRMHEAGVGLAVGTDWLDPGHAVLSEMILLQRAGIPMADVLCIATRGGARVMERENDYGTIEPGPQGAGRHLRSQPTRGSRGGAGRENRDQGRDRRPAALTALRYNTTVAIRMHSATLD